MGQLSESPSQDMSHVVCSPLWNQSPLAVTVHREGCAASLVLGADTNSRSKEVTTPSVAA